jgi:hypothetical protein
MECIWGFGSKGKNVILVISIRIGLEDVKGYPIKKERLAASCAVFVVRVVLVSELESQRIS